MKPKFQHQIYPDSLIFIRAEDGFCKVRAKKLDHEAVDYKWSHENMERRLEKWREHNDVGLFVSANNNKDLGLPTYKMPKLPMNRFF